MEPLPKNLAAEQARLTASAEERFQDSCQQQAVFSATSRQQCEPFPATPLTPSKAAAPLDEDRLRQRHRSLEWQEQQFADYLDARRRQLLTQEDQVRRELQAAATDREQFVQESARQACALEQSQRQLQQQQEQLIAARQRYARQQIRLHKHWKRRWDQEWANLQREAGTLAASKYDFEQQHREANGALVVERVRLEESWTQLRQEQQRFREQRKDEEARLQARVQELAQRERSLVQASEDCRQDRQRAEAAESSRQQELQGLERRIQNYRDKLAQLRDEAASLEKTLCERPTIQGNGETAKRGNGDSACPALPSTLAPAAEHRRFLDSLQAAAEDLADEGRRLAELQTKLLNIKQAWEWEWDMALASLALREQELHQREERLVPREHALKLAEQYLERRAREVARLHGQLQCWEARLFKQQSLFHGERSRLVGIIKARADATQAHHRLVVQQQRAWEEERRTQSERYRSEQEACERTRRDYARLRELLRQKLAELDQRERSLLEREFVLTQVKQELLADDPQPVEAEIEIEDREQHWQRLALRPVRAIRRQQRAVAKRAAELESREESLGRERSELEARQAECARLRTALEIKQTSRGAEHIRRQHELEALRVDRQRLQQQVHDLQQQIDRLAALLMDTGEAPPPIALAA